MPTYIPGDLIPFASASLTADQLPSELVKSVKSEFNKDKPESWSKLPLEMRFLG